MAEDQDTLNRRSFLTKLFWGAAGAMGLASVWLGGGFLYPVPERKRKPLFICLDSEVSPGTPKEIVDPNGRKVLLIRTDKEILAIGTVCTHLGCSVFYRAKEDIFECPCHQGVFDGLGNPVSGPPQEPLKRYPVDIRQGKIFISFA